MPVSLRKQYVRSRATWLRALCLGVAAVMTAMGIARAADAKLQTMHDRLGFIGDTYDSAERDLGESARHDRDLTALRDKINPLRAEIRKQIEILEPRVSEAQNRLKEVGAAPTADAPAEDPRVTAERATLTALFGELNGILKQAKLLGVRGDQLIDRIETSRRALFTERLLTHSGSILSPALWIPAAQPLRDEAGRFAALLSDWKSYAEENAGYTTLSLAILAIAALIAAVLLLRWIALRRIGRYTKKHDNVQSRQSGSPFLVAARTAIDAAAPPIVVFVAIQILLAFDLIFPRLDRITSSLLISIAIFSIGSAVTRAMLTSPRLTAIYDEKATAALYRAIVGAIVVMAVMSVIYGFHRILGAPTVVRNVTSAVTALCIGIFMVRALLVPATEAIRENNGGFVNLFRLLGWIAAAVIFTALMAGYLRLAVFTAARAVDSIITVGVVVLLLSLIDATFATGYSEEGTQRRKVAAALGVNPARLDFFATVLSGLLRALLFVIASFVIIGGWRTSVTDARSKLDEFDLVFQIGQSKIALGNIILAIAALVIGLILTRIVHRWLTQAVLPRSSMDPGLQHSVATMFVYIGFIIAALLALHQLGINLQNIALIAGALSVGIGFGLQSIVSNFVSGIILLAERPIRVGDIIVVKGEEGYVRRISVRATEIETFDRANVIIPNSDLVSSIVKNWTHANTSGRTALKIGVSYGADPEQVREILLATVIEHPQVLKTPEPRVLLLGFGVTSLEFELRCIITNIDFVATVRSDLYFGILRNLRAAGIEVPPK